MVPSGAGHRRRSVLAGVALVTLAGCSSLQHTDEGSSVTVREVEILNYDDEPHTGEFSVEDGGSVRFERSFDLTAKAESGNGTHVDAAVFEDTDASGRELTLTVAADGTAASHALSEAGAFAVFVVITEDGEPVFRIEALE